ncbi:MAG: hypothetical protein U0136_20060 [Bdellovibrionota bacterium]
MIAWSLFVLSLLVLGLSLRSASLDAGQPKIIHVPSQPRYDHDDDDDDGAAPNMTLVSNVFGAPMTGGSK